MGFLAKTTQAKASALQERRRVFDHEIALEELLGWTLHLALKRDVRRSIAGYAQVNDIHGAVTGTGGNRVD